MSDAWQTALTVLQEAQPDIPLDALVMTVLVEFPPTVTMMCVPGRPMLELVDEHELEQRKELRWRSQA